MGYFNYIYITAIGFCSIFSNAARAQFLGSDQAASNYINGSLWTSQEWEFENFLERQGVASRVEFGTTYRKLTLKKQPDLADLLNRAQGMHTSDLYKIDPRFNGPGDNGIFIFEDSPYVRAKLTSHALGHVDGKTQKLGDGLDRLREDLRVSGSDFANTRHGARMKTLMTEPEIADLLEYSATETINKFKYQKELDKLKYMKKSLSDSEISVDLCTRTKIAYNRPPSPATMVGPYELAGAVGDSVNRFQENFESSQNAGMPTVVSYPEAAGRTAMQFLWSMGYGTLRTVGDSGVDILHFTQGKSPTETEVVPYSVFRGWPEYINSNQRLNHSNPMVNFQEGT